MGDREQINLCCAREMVRTLSSRVSGTVDDYGPAATSRSGLYRQEPSSTDFGEGDKLRLAMQAEDLCDEIHTLFEHTTAPCCPVTVRECRRKEREDYCDPT